MNKRSIILSFLVAVILIIGGVLFISNNEDEKVINLNEAAQGQPLSIRIVPGENYLHKFQLSKLISIKTPPQIAIWVEDTEGNYIHTLYATEKITTKNWAKAPSDRASKIERMEALPVWTHKAQRNQATFDAVSAATPKGGATLNTQAQVLSGPFLIWAEVNMSTDFNAFYPKEAKKGDANYSGGEMGSGQPALLYGASVDLAAGRSYTLALSGHSSVDGSDGLLYGDLSTITTASDIIDRIEVVFE